MSAFLADHRRALETCTFCPKLCRSVCPVALAESRETVTPWGLATRLDDIARGRAALDAETAELLAHCTGCLRCQTACRHQVDVPRYVWAARQAASDLGLTPKSLLTYAREAPLVDTSLAARGETRLLAGHTRKETWDAALKLLQAIEVEAGVPGQGARSAGLRALEAGLSEEALAQWRSLAAGLSDAERLVVIEPEDLYALRVVWPARGFTLPVPVLHLSELLEDRSLRLKGPREAALYVDHPRLGRGAGVFGAPRRLIERVVGLTEAWIHHAEGGCTGSGSGYALTAPQAAMRVAQDLVLDRPASLPVVVVGAVAAHWLAEALKPRVVLEWTVLLASALEGA